MSAKLTTKTVGHIEGSIRSIRGLRVILDRELAEIYDVETKALNRAIARNRKRFPVDFAFRLTRQEFTNLRCQIGTSSSAWGGSRYAPFAFRAGDVLVEERAVKFLAEGDTATTLDEIRAKAGDIYRETHKHCQEAESQRIQAQQERQKAERAHAEALAERQKAEAAQVETQHMLDEVRSTFSKSEILLEQVRQVAVIVQMIRPNLVSQHRSNSAEVRNQVRKARSRDKARPSFPTAVQFR